MAAVIREAGVALLVAFVVGAIFFLGQLMYAQLVLMPRQMTSGSNVLAVTIQVRWAVLVAAAAFVLYLASRLRAKGAKMTE